MWVGWKSTWEKSDFSVPAPLCPALGISLCKDTKCPWRRKAPRNPAQIPIKPSEFYPLNSAGIAHRSCSLPRKISQELQSNLWHLSRNINKYWNRAFNDSISVICICWWSLINHTPSQARSTSKIPSENDHSPKFAFREVGPGSQGRISPQYPT